VSAIGFMCAKPHNDTYRRLLEVHPEETNTAVQLFGSDPVIMGEAAAKLTELGRFTMMDINMGCPARKVVSGGDGSALLLDPDKAYKIMETVQRNTNLPCTIKTRLGYDDEHMTAIELCRAAESLGFLWVGIHGRTRAQQYSGTANYQAIGELKAQLKIPVIANGDVFTPEDAIRIQKETGADGIMIGRGCMGNPWLFRTARQALEGKPVEKETLLERIEMAMLQAEWMVAFKGERLGIVEMRKHVGHYISGLRGATAIRRQVNFMVTLEEMCTLLNTLRDMALQEEEAE